MSEDRQWVSIDEAAQILGVGRRSVHRYIQVGKLTAYKVGVGGRVFLKRADVEAFRLPQLKRPEPIEPDRVQA